MTKLSLIYHYLTLQNDVDQFTIDRIWIFVIATAMTDNYNVIVLIAKRRLF